MPRSHSSVDPFARLGLPRRFDLDRPALEKAYVKASARHHPDRAGDDPEARAEAERTSAAISDAYARLRDDEARANLLLELLGGPDRSEGRDLPDGFLMEMMETREQMEADLGGPDAEAKRSRWTDWARERRRERLAAVAPRFDRLLGNGMPDEAERERLIREIRVELNALRYVERMLEQLDPDYDHAAELRRAEEPGAGR